MYLLEKALAEKPVEVSSQYMGESKEGEWVRDDWAVVLKYQGRSMSTEFHTGVGNRVFPKHKAGWRPHFEEGGEHLFTLDEYKKIEGSKWLFPDTGRNAKINRVFAKPVSPKVPDVLYCLLMDSSALDLTFEEWCSEMGYDTDSRKAEKIYNLCVENARKVKRLLGEDFQYFMDNNEY